MSVTSPFRRAGLIGPALLVVLILVGIPLGSMAWVSLLGRGATIGVDWQSAPSFANYTRLIWEEDFDGTLLFNPTYLSIFWRSVWQAAATTVICVAFGLPVALWMSSLSRGARDIAVLQAANTSLGVTLLARLVEQAALALGPDWDIEIAELHHRLKVDAPSGTALALGEAAAHGRGVDLASHSDRVRDGITGARVEGHIGFASLRGGSAAGDHMVLLASEGERIELWHRAENRSIFARGALRGAQWLAGRKPGRYVMADVLGI